MKTFYLSSILVAAAAAAACTAKPEAEIAAAPASAPPAAVEPAAAPATSVAGAPAAAPVAAEEKTIVLNVEGMTWGVGCATAVRGALEKVPGVQSAKVDLDSKSATVVVKGASTDDLVKAVNAAKGGGVYTASVKP